MPRSFRIIATVLFTVAAAVAFACGGDGDSGSNSDDERLRVVTSVSPITSLAQNVGGTRIRLEGLVPEGVSSHAFEPPVSDVRVLSEADVILINGLQLEEAILDLAETSKKDSAVIVQLGDMTIGADDYKYDFTFPESDGRPNPHLWPDPLLALAYAGHIRDALVEADADNADYYNANYDALETRIEALHAAIRATVETIPLEHQKLLTYHDSWAYFADRYGMTVIGAIQPSDFSEPSAREVADLIDQIEEEGVPAVFGSEVFASPVLEQIAAEGGAEFVDGLRDDDLPGEPGGDLHSYIGLMVENLRLMAPALGGDASAMDNVDAGFVFTDGPGDAKYPK